MNTNELSDMQKVINIIWGISFVITTLALAFHSDIYWYFESKSLLKQYGVSYNSQREKMNIIPIESAWDLKVRENTIRCNLKWEKQGYEGKLIVIQDSIIYEQDQFAQDSMRGCAYIIRNEIDRFTNKLIKRDTSYGYQDSI